MSGNVKAALIVAGGLILAGLLNGGVYRTVRLDSNRIYRFNRFTGSPVLIFPGGNGALIEMSKIKTWHGHRAPLVDDLHLMKRN